MLSTFAWFFLSVNGRISRREFRLGYFLLLCAGLAMAKAWSNVTYPRVVYYDRYTTPPFDNSPLLWLMIILWPLTALFVKRLHDISISGWWLLGVMAVLPLTVFLNTGALSLVGIFAVMLMVCRGASGDNRFGQDPLARRGV